MFMNTWHHTRRLHGSGAERGSRALASSNLRGCKTKDAPLSTDVLERQPDGVTHVTLCSVRGSPPTRLVL